MANKAYQKIYTKLEGITKATVALKAEGVSNDELAVVDGRLAQVVKTKGPVFRSSPERKASRPMPRSLSSVRLRASM